MILYTKDVVSALKTPEEDMEDLEDRIRKAIRNYGDVPDLAIMAYQYFHVPYGRFSEILDKIKEVNENGE